MTEFFENKPFALDIPENGGVSICLLGSTRAGKSFALAHLFNQYFRKHVSVLMTNSPQAPIYKEMKQAIQCDQWIPRVVKDMASINKQTNNKYQFLAILDDIVTGIKFDKQMIKMLCVYRNSNVSTVITAQAANLLNSAGRTNINFILCMKLNSDEMIEKVIKYYLRSYFPAKTNMTIMINYYREMTENHYMFVVDNLNGQVYRTRIEPEKNIMDE